ncbi:MAG: DNA-formamidopyrimidine glycosylase [Chloroflexi bacterium]|nr:DNA-formamidopyrimidine glycosylase [Chloroflexota bacterium]
MPELPEVETIARALRPELVGRTILEADVRWARTIAEPSAKKFRDQIKGQEIIAVSRRAKFINIQLLDFNLFIHLRMSGDLIIKSSKIKAEKHDRLILALSDNKSLVFNDTRKFGRVWLTKNIEEVLGKLGPEPFSNDFTPQWLYNALESRHRQLKPLLLDQTFIAGLGNIYTDEALHMAKLHPLKLSDSVTKKQAERLHQSIREVLQEGIRRNGASIDWVYRGGDFQNHFRVYGRAGEKCPVCGTKIKKIIVGQRGTHYCPNCQRK